MKKHGRILSIAVLLSVSSIVSLLLLEVALRALTRYPITFTSNQQSHPKLAYTLDPALTDVDANGFRNTQYTLETADTIVIGDSHAYGVNVTIADNFPSILANKTGRLVYNFGVSGYGIYQYATLLEEAQRYAARDVILALHIANDLWQYCRPLGTDYWQARAIDTGLSLPGCGDSTNRKPLPSFADAFPQAVAATATVQLSDRLIKRLTRFWSKPDPHPYFVLAENHIVIRRRVYSQAFSTNIANSSVQLNYRNSQKFLLEAHQAFTDASIGFLVVIIPSKELVLLESLLLQKKAVPEEFADLVSNEIALTHQYISFFKDSGIRYANSLPEVLSAMAKTLAAGQVFYPHNESHPLRAGYEAYADAAIRGLGGKDAPVPVQQ